MEDIVTIRTEFKAAIACRFCVVTRIRKIMEAGLTDLFVGINSYLVDEFFEVKKINFCNLRNLKHFSILFIENQRNIINY